MGIQMLIYFVLLGLCSQAQKYPSCPGGVPIDIGNTSDAFYTKLLDLTSFMDYHISGETVSNAFHNYALTGSNAQIASLVSKNRQFFVIIIVILSTLSFVLLIIMCRMGNLQLTNKQTFEKVKEKGYSSPLSAFYSLIAVILLVSSCLNAFKIPEMITSLQMTQCRMDVLNAIYLDGSPQDDWSGIDPFVYKVQIIKNISSQVQQALSNGVSNLSRSLGYSSDYLDDLALEYAGIVNSYGISTLGNTSNQNQTISLKTMVPSLFETTSTTSTVVISRLIEYMNVLNRANSRFGHLQQLLNETYSILNLTVPLLQTLQQRFSISSEEYTSIYSSFRIQLANFFSSSKYLLIVCEVITALTIFGTFISLLSLKLIQNNYDYFSLKVYKVIWACLLLLFCLSLVFLLIFNQALLYNKGMCEVGSQMLTNRTLLEETFPQTKAHKGMYLMTACYYDSNFSWITHTDELFKPIISLISVKEDIYAEFTPEGLGNYTEVLKETENNIREYEYGAKGTFEYMNKQLAFINKYTYNNQQNQNCFKHHWQYSKEQCYQGQSAIYKPNSVQYANSTSVYKSLASQCYILSNFPQNQYPSSITYNQFISLYTGYREKCPYTYSEIAKISVVFFNLIDERVNVFQGLIGSLYNLIPTIKNAVSYLVNYVNVRIPLIAKIFKNIPQKGTYAYLSMGNDCGIIKHLIIGIYNQYCINFKGNSHQIYLMVICNIGYIIGMIVFSMLYAVELRHLQEKEEDIETHKMQFVQTHLQLSSESHSDLNSEQKSTKSQSSGSEG